MRHALKSLEKETDRHDILEMVGASIKRKMRKEVKAATAASATVNACAALASASASRTAVAKGVTASGGMAEEAVGEVVGG